MIETVSCPLSYKQYQVPCGFVATPTHSEVGLCPPGPWDSLPPILRLRLERTLGGGHYSWDTADTTRW